MANPYSSKRVDQVWNLAITGRSFGSVEPVADKRPAPFKSSTIATIGSCFAQHITTHVKASGRGTLLETEAPVIGQPFFSALYGNVYSVRQLLQLFDRAFGELVPVVSTWQRDDGAYIDCFRPFMFAEGFASGEAVEEERLRHFAAVRRVFSECSTLIFTMGLTETWRCSLDGAVLPVAPGVVSPRLQKETHEFVNQSYADIISDMALFLRKLADVNSHADVILTVSPVPLTATYTNEHVLTATMHSKSILRAACSALQEQNRHVYYFPSYEIIAGHFNRGAYYEDNQRAVTAAGVAHVVRVFERTYWGQAAVQRNADVIEPEVNDDIICDENEIPKSIGF